MKRILFLSVIAALICGCNSANHEGQGSANDTVSVDSVANVVIAEPEPAEPQLLEPDSVTEPEKPFTTPDLKWKQLQGHVKQLKVIENNDRSVVYNFDREGKFVSYKTLDTPSYKIERNEMGQITRWHIWLANTELDDYEDYSYNSDGYIYKVYMIYDAGHEDEHVYHLNEQGWPISSTWKSKYVEEDTVCKGKDTYKYSNIDKHGNWRKCVITRKGGPRYKGDKPFKEQHVYTRKITYWE